MGWSHDDWGYEPESDDELTDEERRIFARNEWLALAGSTLIFVLFLVLR